MPSSRLLLAVLFGVTLLALLLLVRTAMRPEVGALRDGVPVAPGTAAAGPRMPLAPLPASIPRTPTDARPLTVVPAPPAVLSLPGGLPEWTVGEWLAGNSADWRAGRVRGYPGVLVIEFPGLAAQGRAMNRLAAFLEKAGAPHDRVLDDAGLADLIHRQGDTGESFYQGHDYRAADLQRFFRQAQQQGLALGADERRLQGLLLAQGLLAADGTGSAMALITFTATQQHGAAARDDEVIDPVRRASILQHELSHGRFFTDPDYRAFSSRFWQNVLSDLQRSHLRALLARLRYDTGNPELVVNEVQALIAHTADPRAFAPEDAGLQAAELERLRIRFARAEAAGCVHHVMAADCF